MKTKKSVSFGYDEVLAHAGLHEHHCVDDQQEHHGQATKKAGAEEPSSSNEGILSQASQHKQQGVEDIEQLFDKRSDDNGKKTMTTSQHLNENNQ